MFSGAAMLLCYTFILCINGFSQDRIPLEERSENMTTQSGLTNGPARVVLEGVPRVGYDSSFCTFPASLKACLEFMGENYTYEYIMGTSGAAFRLLWKPG